MGSTALIRDKTRVSNALMCDVTYVYDVHLYICHVTYESCSYIHTCYVAYEQCVAVCCSVLQCVAVCCSMRQKTHTYTQITSHMSHVHTKHKCSRG